MVDGQRLAVHGEGHQRGAAVGGGCRREPDGEVVDRAGEDLAGIGVHTRPVEQVVSGTPRHRALPTRLPPTSLETHASVTASSTRSMASSSS